MDEHISFKTRVKNVAINLSQKYYSYYVSKDYLLISDSFKSSPYYIISAEKDNYLHLIGVSTPLSANEFFNKCFDGSLMEEDFDLSIHYKREKESKGTIRKKIKALPYIFELMDSSSLVEENFAKNTIFCSLATSDGACTLGFITVPTARPKTLLLGNELDSSKSSHFKIILSKSRKEEKFSSVIVGSDQDLSTHLGTIKHLLSDELISKINNYSTNVK